MFNIYSVKSWVEKEFLLLFFDNIRPVPREALISAILFCFPVAFIWVTSCGKLGALSCLPSAHCKPGLLNRIRPTIKLTGSGFDCHQKLHLTMVLIEDGNSFIGACVRRNLSHSNYLRNLIWSRAVTNRIFLSEKTYFPTCVRNILWVAILYKYHGSDHWKVTRKKTKPVEIKIPI